MTEDLRIRVARRPPVRRDALQPREAHSREHGFTLVELLVVLIILPMIIGALSLGIIAVFSQQAKVSGRLAGSVDLQITNATYIRDVESANWVTTGSTPIACGGVTMGTQLLGLTWSGGQTSVSYVEVPNTSGATVGFTDQLERLYCTNGDNGVPSSVRVVSSDVSPTLQQVPTVTLVGSATSDPYPYSGTANDVASVDFEIYVPDSTNAFAMVASPRQGAGGNLSGSPNFFSPITLSSPTCGTVLSVNNNGTLYINVNGGTGNGFLTVNSPCASTAPVSSGGSSSGTLCVAAIFTNVAPLPTSEYSNPSTRPSGCPSSVPYNYYGSFTDPYAALVTPSEINPTDTGTCTLSNSQYTCTPGYYGSQQSKKTETLTAGMVPKFENGDSILFTGGAYEFSTGSPVTIPNGSTVTFQYGTYYFNSSNPGNAFDVASNSSVNSGSTVFGNGALFYAPYGNISFGNNSTVDLVANPNYLGVSVWDGPKASACQPGSNLPSPYVTLGLSNNGNDTYGGLYVPCGEISTGQVGALNATFIVASSASFANNTTIIVTTP